MTPQSRLNLALNHWLPEKSLLTPAQWCVEHLQFHEAGNHGPFKTQGAEYIIDPLNDFANAAVSDEVLVWGSQSWKTGTLMGGAAWSVVNDPCGTLWVTPSFGMATRFSQQRWKPLLRASRPLADLIPNGAERHDFSNLTQLLGASAFNFVGSNSPANLASMPCRRVILDEVDKFDPGDHGEADAVNLAEQRTKGQINPQRWKTSTPTMMSGLVWQEFLKGNRMRYFIPCPKCSQEILFIWNRQYTILKLEGCEAEVKWDSEAKIKNGDWDLARVERTAHVQCPHCGCSITDAHKPSMIKAGKWKATVDSSLPGFISRHLPSLYSTMPECRFGKLAVKFLQAKRSVMGLRGFINGDLAEPYLSQDTSLERIELITGKIDLTEGWTKIMTVDCQHKQPYFWYVIRAWKEGESQGIKFGSADSFEEIRTAQKENGVSDVAVAVDSGFHARSGEAEIYRNCSEFGEIEPRRDKLPLHVGWLPTKGMPSRKRWRNKDTGAMEPWYFNEIDPFLGTADAGRLAMSLFEFSGDYFKDVLDNLRTGRTKEKWSVLDKMGDMALYWKHMDGEVKTTVVNKMTGYTKVEWRPRHRDWPNHGFDCETLQVAIAMSFGLLSSE